MKVILILLVSMSVAAFALPAGFPVAMSHGALMGVDSLESADGRIIPAADILSCYFDGQKLRVRLPLMVDFVTKANDFERNGVHIEIDLGGEISINVGPTGAVRASQSGAIKLVDVKFMPQYGTIDLILKGVKGARPRITVRSFVRGEPADVAVFDPDEDPTYTTNCAFVHHGNQSLSYSDVLRGRYGADSSSGFDEVLEAHQTYNIPGNFHMSGTIQTGAAWYDPDFNTWLANGVSAGWVEMITSAYAQHIMPFVADNMNSWSVNIENQMVYYRYGFTPRVAWVPERTFLSPTDYPNAGVADYIADDFVDNGVWAIILDDNVHLNGYDNHQIHYLTDSTLRLIPRDNDFTGKLHAGDRAGAMNNLVALANTSDGPYRIVVYADDWEMAAEMGEWASSMSTALETYEWMIQQCSIESSWLNVWKLTDAVANPNFNGDTITPRYGTHSSIGGTGGYGGGDNGWYTHWAGYASPSDQHTPSSWNFGHIWSDANTNLSTCPDNNTAQAGWYVLMSNLYETGWHDGMGGPISGWEMKHSTHIKNANVYAEAARWANGDLGTTPSATYADWDHDGDNELVIRNDRVCAVFEHIGGRAHWIFGRGGATGWEGSIAGNCNAYWEGTEGDYNDANHIAPLSDVGVGGYDYENSLYTSSIEFSGADSAVILLSNYYLQKRIKVVSGEPFLRVYYDSGPDMTYIKSGFTPDLVDVVWNADVDRLWSAGAYCGFYNPNTHAAAAIIMGNGGASHSSDFQSTILKGDEVDGQGGFGFYIFAGELADVSGLTSTTLNSLAAGLSDVFPPKAYYASYHPGTDVMEIAFGDLVRFDDVTRTNIGVDGDGDGVSDVMLDSGCAVINSADARHIRIQISAAKAAAIEALTMTDPHLHLLADAFVDLAGNGNLTQTATVGDPVALNVLPNTSITIDGFIDMTEWVSATRVLDDPDTDSEWGSSNEIYDLNLYWDATYLYLGLHGVKETDTRFTNSWLIYLDTDPGGPNGAADLTMIDNWDRNAEFSGGFKADIQYGSYGSADGDVWHITSPTTSTQITDGVIVNTDLSADRPGSEVAISWDAIYGLGSGIVPTGAQIAMCASIAGGTDLGGDCVPNQLSAVFPVLDNFYTQVIDGDGDGVPDDFDDIVSVGEKADLPASFEILAYPNPFNSAVTISLSAGVGASDARSGQVGIEIFDISGHLVADLPVTTCGSPQVVPTPVIWQPEKSVGSGVYLVRARAGGKSLVKRVVYIK